ncbi:MAG TPA: hypothetical protein VK899_09770, partial [Gemmatimonadales bacterium]|nr:hypothetical protein [Gemmatimonadales bacterium]
MSRVAILLDIEEGHYLATFQLARGLRARGHTICYLGLAGAEPLVLQQGFDFVPMFGETLPGSRLANLASTSSFDVTRALVDGGLDRLIERVRPDVLIMLSLFYLSALIIECRYRLPVVLLTPSYRSETRLQNAQKK